MTIEHDDAIQPAEIYKGVALHDCQPRDRIERIVKPNVDAVLAMRDARELVEYAADVSRPPETRLLAAAKAEAMFEIAADERQTRPDIDLDRLHASIAGLASRKWRSPACYGTLLEPPSAPGRPGAAPRDEGSREAVELDQAQFAD